MAVTAQITHLWDTRDVFTDTDHTRSAPHPGLPTHQLIQLSAISVVFGVYHKMTLETAEDLTPGDEYRLSGNRVDARLTPDGRCCTVNIELLERIDIGARQRLARHSHDVTLMSDQGRLLQAQVLQFGAEAAREPCLAVEGDMDPDTTFTLIEVNGPH